ncbi:MAG TPA: hypothetical protein VKU00_24425 [Chthonomonadaceae bacterium]|nr:hypothetical protein [Chthonomonadaceae bacterium]
MWVRTMEGKLINLANASCIEWYHLEADSDRREDIYHVRAQMGKQEDEFYVLARNLTQAEAESILRLITKSIGISQFLDLRDYEKYQTVTSPGAQEFQHSGSNRE